MENDPDVMERTVPAAQQHGGHAIRYTGLDLAMIVLLFRPLVRFARQYPCAASVSTDREEI